MQPTAMLLLTRAHLPAKLARAKLGVAGMDKALDFRASDVTGKAGAAYISEHLAKLHVLFCDAARKVQKVVRGNAARSRVAALAAA